MPAPQLLNGSIFLQVLKDYRVLWLDGRYGGGKTLLAWYLAARLVDMGYARYISSNVPCVWGDGLDFIMENVRGGMFLDTVFILDEAGLFIENSNQAKSFNAFLRKYNVYLLLPTVEPPASRLQRFSVFREINWSAFGLPIWQYKATLKTGQSSGKASKDSMRFWFLNPQSMYGIYDTQAAPTDASAISDLMKEHYKNVSKLQGRGEVQLSALEGGWRESDALIEAAERQSEALSLLDGV